MPRASRLSGSGRRRYPSSSKRPKHPVVCETRDLKHRFNPSATVRGTVIPSCKDLPISVGRSHPCKRSSKKSAKLESVNSVCFRVVRKGIQIATLPPDGYTLFSRFQPPGDHSAAKQPDGYSWPNSHIRGRCCGDRTNHLPVAKKCAAHSRRDRVNLHHATYSGLRRLFPVSGCGQPFCDSSDERQCRALGTPTAGCDDISQR